MKRKIVLTSLLFVMLFSLSGCMGYARDGVLGKAWQKDLEGIDNTEWFPITDELYGYTFKYPADKFFLIRSQSNAESPLYPGQSVPSYSTGISDDYYIYFIPENVFPLVDMDSNLAIEREEIEFAGRKAILETYDEENMFIRFDEPEGFRIQVYVDEEYKDEGWAYLDKVLQTFEFVSAEDVQ